MISFREILDYMKTGQVFTCEVVSYSAQQQRGGKIKSYRAVLLTRSHGPRMRGLTAKEKAAQEQTPYKATKDAKHHEHYTRNIQLVTADGFETEIIRTIHIPLIIKFNDQTVTP